MEENIDQGNTECYSKSTLEQVKARGRQLRSANRDKGFKLLSGDTESISVEKLNVAPSDVGVVYDELMLEPHCVWDEKFPECPERLSSILKACGDYGLLERCVRVPAREALMDELLLVHDESYIDTLQATSGMDEQALHKTSAKYDGVYFHRRTYDAALLAAGSSVELVEQVVNGQLKHGMALVRPPGHHAMRDAACGYCFINNVAVAAKHAVHNLGVKRVLIVDIDVHHGQGTQFAFYDDPRVLYFSVHRYDWGEFWPKLRESDYDYIGTDNARGYNINVPFNQIGMTDADYMAIVQQILLPVAYEFTPELVIVSQGYDAALGDPEGCSNITPAWYAHLIHALKPLAAGKLAVILEGGYCIKAQAEAAALTLRELLGDPVPFLPPSLAPMDSTKETILQVARVLRPYWKSLCYQEDVESPNDLPSFFQNIQVPKPGVELCTADNKPEQYELDEDYESYPEGLQAQFHFQLDLIKQVTTLLHPKHKVSLVYDEKMKSHKCTSQGDHPERPARVVRIYEKLQETGLLDQCIRVESRRATEEELNLVHEKDYIDEVKLYQTQEIGDLHRQERRFDSIYLSQEAYECASIAVGSTLNVVDSVMTGASSSGVCVVRPPGHHAESDTCMGFCFFNTVAVAARYAQKHHGVKRVLILDWDVHHGNGTQNMFYDDPSVLYISIHRHDYGSFFPVGPDGNHTFVGSGDGEGFNINVPWSKGGMGDAEYIAAFQQIVMPVAYEYSPDLVLVSAGFDAARGDPLGGCRITPPGYAHLTHMLTGLAMGRVIMVLEGGYNLLSISESMAACTCTLLGYPCPQFEVPMIPTRSAERSICGTLDTHKGYWKSLCYRECMVSREETKRWLGDFRSETDKTDGSLESLSKKFAHATVSELQGGTSHSDSMSDTEVDKSTLSQNEASPAKDDSQYTLPAPLQSTENSMESNNSNLKTNSHDAPETSRQQNDDPNLAKTTENNSNDTQSNILNVATTSNDGPGKVCEDANSEGGATGGSDHPAMSVPYEFIGGSVESEGNVTMYAVHPKQWCEHLDTIRPVPDVGLDVTVPCDVCGHVGENWVCLTCYQVHCGRFVNEHMLMHGLESEHRMVLSYADLSVWCYACDSYVHHKVLLPAKRAAHVSKFNEDIPGH